MAEHAETEFQCPQCGRRFQLPRWVAARKRFCGEVCWRSYQKTHPPAPNVTCETCGKGLYRTPGNIKRNIFCSKACHIVHQRTLKRPGPDLEERFWQHVTKSDGCWEWQGKRGVSGYGVICFRNTLRVASRVSWEIHNGPIPEGLFACHHCDNPLCVNPDHLFLGTNSDNFRDMLAKGRHTFQKHPGQNKGEGHPGVRLTEAQVLEIRRLGREGQLFPHEIAMRFPVKTCTVRAILHRKLWKHLPEEE